MFEYTLLNPVFLVSAVVTIVLLPALMNQIVNKNLFFGDVRKETEHV